MAENMKAFLKGSAIALTEKEYVASERFVDEQGNPIPWRLRVLGTEEVEKMERNCKKKEFSKGTREYKTITDTTKLQEEMVSAAVVYPCLDDAELQESYGTVGAVATVKAMLTPGEYVDLANAVAEVSGYQAGMSDKITTAKN